MGGWGDSMHIGRLGAAVLVSCALICHGADFMGDTPDGALLYGTLEDAPQWEVTLPHVEHAVRYELSCFPKMASFFQLEDTGRFAYLGLPDAYSKSAVDTDVFSYHGLVPQNLAAVVEDPWTYDCTNSDTDAERALCRTPIRLVKVYIEPVNDAPVAAQGEPYMAFVAPSDFIVPNAAADLETWRRLEEPYTLVRSLEGYDADGDRLSYRIAQAPAHGQATVLEDATFKYVPVVGFRGQDSFRYTVDDSRGGGHSNGPNTPPLSSSADVYVQVGNETGPPRALGGDFTTPEDGILIARMGRGAVFGDRLNSIRFRIVDPARLGEAVVLCGGLEVFDPVDCRTARDPALDGPLLSASGGGGAGAGRHAYFRYTPPTDASGEDSFSYAVEVAGEDGGGGAGGGGSRRRALALASEPAVVRLTIEAVNDPPVVSDSNHTAPMHPGDDLRAELGLNASYGTLLFRVEDRDSSEVVLSLERLGTDESAWGELFRAVSPSGEPRDPVPFPNGAAEVALTREPVSPGMGGVGMHSVSLYYVPPALRRGAPVEAFRVKAFDGEEWTRVPAAAAVSTGCAAGFKRSAASPRACVPCAAGTVAAYEDSGACSVCPRGTAARAGRGECALCAAGTFGSAAGAAECDVCGPQATSQPGSFERSQCYCERLHYGPPGGACYSCERPGPPGINTGPDGDPRDLRWTQCSEDGYVWPVPQHGFYVDTLSLPAAMRECSPHEACLEPPSAAAVAEGGTCAEGYHGPRCSRCSDGYYRASSACHKCQGPAAFPLILVAMLAVVMTPLALKLLDLRLRFAAFDVVLGYTQVAGIMGRYFLNWPRGLRNFVNAASLFNLNLELLHLECEYEWDFKRQWQLKMALPAYVALILLVAWVAATLLWVFRRARGGAEGAPASGAVAGAAAAGAASETLTYRRALWREQVRLATKFARAYLTFLHISYVFLCVGVFEMFDCVLSESSAWLPDEHYLQVAPHIRCYNFDDGEVWGELFPWAVACLILYPVGVLLVFAALLFHARTRLAEPSTHALLGFCLTQYKPKRWFYELLILLRFAALAACTAINLDATPGGTLRQVVTALVVLLVAQAFKNLLAPYRVLHMNVMERVSLVSSTITLAGGLAFLAPQVSFSFRKTLETFSVVVVVLTYLIFLAIAVVDQMPRGFTRRAAAEGKGGLRGGGGDVQSIAAAASGYLAGRARKAYYSARGAPDPRAPGSTPSAKNVKLGEHGRRLSEAGGEGGGGGGAGGGAASAPAATFGNCPERLPQGLVDLVDPEVWVSLFSTATAPARVCALRGAYRAMAKDLEVVSELKSASDRITIDGYLRPGAREGVLAALASRSKAANHEALELLEEVMGVAAEDKYRERYHGLRASNAFAKRLHSPSMVALTGGSGDRSSEASPRALPLPPADRDVEASWAELEGLPQWNGPGKFPPGLGEAGGGAPAQNYVNPVYAGGDFVNPMYDGGGGSSSDDGEGDELGLLGVASGGGKGNSNGLGGTTGYDLGNVASESGYAKKLFDDDDGEGEGEDEDDDEDEDEDGGPRAYLATADSFRVPAPSDTETDASSVVSAGRSSMAGSRYSRASRSLTPPIFEASEVDGGSRIFDSDRDLASAAGDPDTSGVFAFGDEDEDGDEAPRGPAVGREGRHGGARRGSHAGSDGGASNYSAQSTSAAGRGTR